MKTICWSVLLTLLIVACSPTVSPTRHPTASAPQLLTPTLPEDTRFFDGCTHMVNYPAQLMTTDGILFESEQQEEVSVFIIARRRSDAEETLSLAELAIQVASKWVPTSQSDPLSFEQVEIVDYLGSSLAGLKTDLADEGGQHLRLMVVLRPQTLLGDQLSEDVLYEVVAQAPELVWPEWEPLFETMFQTFHPISCGGV